MEKKSFKFLSPVLRAVVKEYRRLAGFAKTKELAPGEKQSLSITFPLYQLTSYEEETASWVLDLRKLWNLVEIRFQTQQQYYHWIKVQ